jgi:anti-sigma factor RsiW
MNCTQFQDQLFDYLDGTVPDPVRAEIAAHLAACSACAGRVASERAAAERFSAASRKFQLDPALRTRLTALLSEPRPARFPWWRVLVPLAAAVGIGVLVMRWDHRPSLPVQVAPVAAYKSLGAQDYILAAKPAGIGHTKDGVPYRFLRCIGVRREVWKKTADGSEVAVVMPQEQIMLARMDVY